MSQDSITGRSSSCKQAIIVFHETQNGEQLKPTILRVNHDVDGIGKLGMGGVRHSNYTGIKTTRKRTLLKWDPRTVIFQLILPGPQSGLHQSDGLFQAA